MTQQALLKQLTVVVLYTVVKTVVDPTDVVFDTIS